ncbi:hypothetical protein NMY22_g8602 [Coprinellus aureogranulatus]|nr:hypothetical protein NMY22_g8602 [Coprinellus aureogranulatus]
MGRPAKYFTREERLAARRNRLRERYQDPQFVQIRSVENRRYYAKKRLRENASLTIPEHLKQLGSQPYSFKDEDVLKRFRGGFNNIEPLTVCSINDALLDDYSRLPPYPSKSIKSIILEKDWDALSAALHGYQVRKYLDSQHKQLRHYRSQTKVMVSAGLVSQFHRLHEFFEILERGGNHYEKKGDLVASHIAKQTARWQATMMVYIHQDLEALAEMDDSYLTLVYNRISDLGSSSGE